jgi:hypothetical protein
MLTPVGLAAGGLVADSPPAPSPASLTVVQLPPATPEASSSPLAVGYRTMPQGIVEVVLSLLSLRWGGDAEDVPPGAGQHRCLPDRLGGGCDQGQVGQRLSATPLGAAVTSIH